MKPQNFGRYQVVGSLGMGAMGCVYEGFDPHIERRVAIKTIRLEQLTPEMEAEFEARFRSEVRAAGRLHHPNIVALHDAGRDEGVAYTVMEFVEGQDLKRHLDGGAVYSVDGALRLVQLLLSALAAAHAQGVIHRDVKPANVMLTAGGQVKLTDFGVARVLDSGDATRTRGMIVGTVKYASPEQLSGLPLDGRSDLFSVGVLLYRLLARQHPFEGPNELAIMQKVLH
jgi:serine/threonine-protein kinase